MNKKGSSLIETMVAMILLMIIALSSAFYFTIPPFRKEARRFAALERAHGVMDLAYYYKKIGGALVGFYKVDESGGGAPFSDSTGSLLPLTISTNMPPVWYTFKVASATTVVPLSGILEAELKLYDDQMNTNSLFATFKMLLPPPSS